MFCGKCGTRLPSDGSDLKEEQSGQWLSAKITELLRQSLEDPAKALPQIDLLARAANDPKAPESVRWIPHFLYFVAHANVVKKRAGGVGKDGDALAAAEKSLTEYRLACEKARFEESETYEEDVEIRPARFFRQAQTARRTKTRTVLKSYIPDECADLTSSCLDAVADLLEESRPGSVQKLLGRIKLKYLAKAGALFLAPVILSALEKGNSDFFSRSDLAALGEFFVTSKGNTHIAFGILGWGNGNDFVLSLFDSEPAQGGNRVGGIVFRKTQGRWEKLDI